MAPVEDVASGPLWSHSAETQWENLQNPLTLQSVTVFQRMIR